MYAITSPSQPNPKLTCALTFFSCISDILIFVSLGPPPTENHKVSVGLGSSHGFEAPTLAGSSRFSEACGICPP
jgi:hypothetical protein